VKVSDVRGLVPEEMTPTVKTVSGVSEVVPDKKVTEYIAASRAAMRAAGETLKLEFSDDGSYRTVHKESLVHDSIKNTGTPGALRGKYTRMYLHSDGELTDDPVPLADRQEKITERPPLSTLGEDGETPITVIPPDFE
jgi:hypothetical protein